MNTTLLKALNQIVSNYGRETLADPRRVKALLADLAASEPKPQKNALIVSLEQGFAVLLQNIPANERGQAKAKLIQRLNREEGLDPALCADTLDLLEAALFGTGGKSPGTTRPGNAVCPSCGAALPGEARFCLFCGAPVASSAPWTAPASPVLQGQEVWRELHTLTGHTRQVWPVAYNPDGRRIASGSLDNTIKIWDAESGRELHTLTGHTDYVYSVAYSPDGRRITSGSGDKTIKIWDAESGCKLHTLTGHTNEVITVAYSPDGRRIASGSGDKTIKIWDAENGRVLRSLKRHTGRVWFVVYSPDGRRIASGSGDKTIKIWDAESGRVLHTLTGHTHYVYSVAYSPDGRRIASGSRDNTIKIWSIK